MGRVYCGPYAGEVGCEHEGYAARVLPNGELTAIWRAETDEFIAFVAACACEWTGGERYAPTEAGEDAALEFWDREHLQPLIRTAAREGWRRWGGRAASAASEVAAYVGADRYDLAVPVMRRLLEDVQTWARILEEIAAEHAAAGGGER